MSTPEQLKDMCFSELLSVQTMVNEEYLNELYTELDEEFKDLKDDDQRVRKILKKISAEVDKMSRTDIAYFIPIGMTATIDENEAKLRAAERAYDDGQKLMNNKNLSVNPAFNDPIIAASGFNWQMTIQPSENGKKWKAVNMQEFMADGSKSNFYLQEILPRPRWSYLGIGHFEGRNQERFGDDKLIVIRCPEKRVYRGKEMSLIDWILWQPMRLRVGFPRDREYYYQASIIQASKVIKADDFMGKTDLNPYQLAQVVLGSEALFDYRSPFPDFIEVTKTNKGFNIIIVDAEIASYADVSENATFANVYLRDPGTFSIGESKTITARTSISSYNYMKKNVEEGTTGIALGFPNVYMRRAEEGEELDEDDPESYVKRLEMFTFLPVASA